ncbi:hypothetical protein C9374_012788 [Naegleria lovaniensis]|uniref:Uncharacterized protein n=1 Tax=Naegleria lovaniensis TaxID=51637 RepID=A0AA88GFN7_NAELO|nr:uncharacterized protein C9374_012788 [Naegleria lovaniensis]KAG2373186.1 hypothetical protein C9374_012788 [Naegleria lovaniensis]
MDPQTRSVYGIDTNALTFFREELKPKCSELATLLQQVTYPLSESTTAKLKTSLTNITQFITDCNHDIDMFLDYITFPLLLILEKDFIYRKKKATSNGMPSLVLEKTLDALSACFRKLKSMEQGEKFIALFQSLFIIHIVYADDDHSTLEVFVNTSSIASSEELKLSLIHAFRDFVNCQWTYSHSSKLFTLQSISIFASKLLDVAVKEKNRLLVETSLRAIGDLLTLCRKTKGHLPDDNFKHIIESIFPGLISQVSKLIISPPFISRAVQCAAFDLFGTVTCMNCSDALNGFIPEVQTTESENNSESSLTIEKLSQMIFTSDDKKKQVKAKFEKFEPFLRKIFSTEIYAQYSSTVTFDQVTEIQQCMLENCANILTECSHALYDSVDVLVECLLVGGRDNIETMEYSDSIESRFLTLVKSIPSTCKTTNEKEKTVTFKLFHSYLEYILKSQKGSNFIASDEMVSEMTLSLMLSLQMDHYNPITEDNQFPKKIFVNFVDDRMIQVIYSICHLLGRKLSLLSKPYIEHLLSIAFSIRGKSSESSYRNESVLVLIQILEGLLQDKSCSHNTIQDFSKTVIHTIIDTMSEKLIETSSDSIETNCLILECMSTVAKFVDPNRHDERDMLLLKILYPILNQLGYPSIHIRQSCFKTISEISKHFYPNKEISSSPRDCVMYLLVTNFDYMIDDIRYRLKYLSLYPHIPQVLNTLFEYNVIGKKFTESISYSELTNHKREEFSAHLNMVSIVDDCIQSVFNAIDQQQQFTDSKRTTLPTLFSILGNIIKTLHVLKQERESLDLSEKKELTEKEITTIKAILSKLQHFMNSSQNSLLNSVSFLTIIENAIAMFEHSNIREEDEHSTGNKILSSIHLLWPMLMTHLLQKRTSITLKQRTLELIQLLGTKFHDFLGSRILSELIPYLNRILKDYHHSQVELKYKKEPMRMDYYKTEPEYKYLRAILCFLIQMLQTTTMKENIEHSSWKELQLQVIEKLKYAKDESVPEEIRSLASQLNDRLTHVAEHTESNAEF